MLFETDAERHVLPAGTCDGVCAWEVDAAAADDLAKGYVAGVGVARETEGPCCSWDGGYGCGEWAGGDVDCARDGVVAGVCYWEGCWAQGGD